MTQRVDAQNTIVFCLFFQKHDGTVIATASESALTDEEDLQPLGIRRWKLQKILYNEAVKQGIPIHFGKKVVGIKEEEEHQNGVGGRG